MLAIPCYFTGVIHREELFGKAYLFITAISLFWGVYSGTLIDRYSRKKIFLVMNLAGLFVLSAVTLIGFKNDGLPWYLVAGIFTTTAFIYNIHFPNFCQQGQQKSIAFTQTVEQTGHRNFTRKNESSSLYYNLYETN